MMKRAGNLIVIFFLLIATGGLSITSHYCGQSFASFSFFSIPEPCCGRDCDKCHNEFSFNKVTDEFTASSSVSNISIVTINPVQASLSIDLSGLMGGTTVSTILTPRKFLYRKTGDLPVSFGNFRC